jgi:hypothetical protein
MFVISCEKKLRLKSSKEKEERDRCLYRNCLTFRKKWRKKFIMLTKLNNISFATFKHTHFLRAAYVHEKMLHKNSLISELNFTKNYLEERTCAQQVSKSQNVDGYNCLEQKISFAKLFHLCCF